MPMKIYMKCCAFTISKSCIFTISEILLHTKTGQSLVRTPDCPVNFDARKSLKLRLSILPNHSDSRKSVFFQCQTQNVYSLCYYIKESMQMGVKPETLINRSTLIQ